MTIHFICNPVYIDGGWSPWSTRVGGSEECIIETSKRMAKDHTVKVFHNGQHGIYEGVEYLDHSEYTPADVTINVNYPDFEPQGKTIYWTSLLNNPDTSKFDVVCGISQYAIDNTGLPDRTIIVSPGYDDTSVKPDKKIAKQCFYGSSPDRGLDILLEAWPRVLSAQPDATLVVTYGGLIDLPNVINLGVVDVETMNQIFATSEYWCHPANGGELYCMTGVKAQAAQCIPVVIPTMALAETVKDGVFATKDNYAEQLIRALSLSEPEKRAIKFNLSKHHYWTWKDTTNKLLSVIADVVK
jgi:glycosyltransferase involved in cell wall biosynthesis